MTAQHLSLRKLVALAALAVVASLAMFAQPAASQGPAAPFILEPGIDEVFAGNSGIFTANVFCGPWKAVVQFTAGIGGRRYVTRTIYVCDNTERAQVTFKVRPSQLGPNGNYQYKIKVGRHTANGQVTRWTHAITGSFNYS